MYRFTFVVYYKLKNRTLLAHLERAVVPAEVTLSFVEIQDAAEFILPKHCYAIVVTDDVRVIRSVKKEHPYIRVLYDGDWDLPMEFLEKIDQCLCVKSEILARRVFEKEVEQLACLVERYLDHDRLEALMGSASDMMWFKRADGIHMDVNRKFTEVVGKTREQCQGATHNYIWNVTDEAAEEGVGCAESEEQVMTTGQAMTFEEFVQIGEEMKQLTTYKAPLHNPFGEIIGTSGIGHDVTDFQNMGLELTILVENIPLPILICDKNYVSIRMNARFRELTECVGVDIKHFNYLDWKEKQLAALSNPLVNRVRHSVRQEMVGKKRMAECYFSVIEQEIRDYFGNVSGYYVLIVDNTVERRYEKSILQAANTDELTGLCNRRYFYECLTEKAREPITMLYMDLDRFKKVNDDYGHARGDDVLKRTAQHISEIFHDGVVARLGGDEFAVLLDGVVDDGLLATRCEKLREEIRGVFRKGDFHISASIGIVKSEGGILDVDAFIHEGDQRMYEEKKRHHAERT